MDRGLELFMAIHRDLASCRIWEPPRVYLSPGLPNASQYMEICKRHQGIIVTNEEEATHVIIGIPGLRDLRDGNLGRGTLFCKYSLAKILVLK